MLALSLRQPWLHTILKLGKRVENRTWSTPYRGPILLHASKGMTKAEYYAVVEFVRRAFPGRELEWSFPGYAELPRGGIVGRARIVDCVTEHASPWFFGPYGFVLDDVAELPFVACSGALGLFKVPDDVAARCA